MNNSFDIKRARKDTRACENIVHFNNAGSSLMPIPVTDVLHTYLHKEEQAGGYETAEEEYLCLDNFSFTRPHDIFLLKGLSRSPNVLPTRVYMWYS